MATVTCSRCGQTRDGAGKVGLPGTLGAAVEENVCAQCWQEWLQTQIRVINHYGLRPALREDREKLYELTREFFGLPPDEATAGRV
ncbi:MAG TPA: Fe(2+)-trafficking protein [Candidatus Limnocylindria bacterium]|nr:Fe(2+)-trafficking protein [Candidatus Limnocylindria bacterium]